MTSLFARRIAALCGFLAVALGAFGAHALQGTLALRGTTEIWKTAALYHLVHSVLLWVLADRPVLLRSAFFCVAGGLLIFSGSLYALAMTGQHWLGAITPLGGLLLLAGWLLLAKNGTRA